MIYGPKADGYLVEFRTAEGQALSIAGTEAARLDQRRESF
jgi:hypothetical protein